jgi:tetratricopeptide (TPR) repeat protein
MRRRPAPEVAAPVPEQCRRAGVYGEGRSVPAMNETLRPTPALDLAALAAGDVFAQALPAGTAIGAYRLVRVLGAGGFGITYLAVDRALGLDMAVKEFLPSAIAARGPDGIVQPLSPAQAEDYDWGLERFRAEARTLAKLEHANIVRVRDFREANRTAYSVMEFVPGETLEARLQRSVTLSARELAAVLPGLFAGIEAVHAAGFLHRDLKPSNIMLRPDGTPVLIDFGAARQALGTHSRSLTAILSEGYAPYEQYQRDGDQGAWTDVYALGATLYRCIAGEKPPEATRRIDARVKDRPDPLVPARELGAGRYPEPLLAAIDRALSTLESERPRTLAEFRALAGGGEAAASAPSDATLAAGAAAAAGGQTLLVGARSVPGAHEPAPARRWPLRAALIAGAVLLTAGAGAAGYVAYRDHRAAIEAARLVAAEEAEKRAAAEERRREAERAAEAERQAAADDLAAGSRELDAGAPDAALALLARAIESGKLTQAQHVEALLARGRAYGAKRDIPRALAEVEAAIRLDPASAPAFLEHGRIQWHRRLAASALADFNEAIRLDPDYAEAYSLRGIVWFHRRDFDRAIADYSEALRLKPTLAEAHFNRGLAWQEKGERERAIEDFRAALRADPPDEVARNAQRILHGLGAAR